MKRRNRRVIVVERGCFRGHAPLRIRRNNGKVECLQCLNMRRKWSRMLSRCYNPKHPRYEDYGGRGIAVCERWRKSFVHWYADFGYKLDGTGLTIDRIDNDGDYEPGNVRAATVAEQNRNNRRTVRITYRGITKTQSEWCKLLKLSSSTIHKRRQKTDDALYLLFGISKISKEGGKVLLTKGRSTKTLRDWADHQRIPLRTVEDRLYKLKWPHEIALGFGPAELGNSNVLQKV